MFGISEFSAIINPPQTAILAVGTGRSELGKFQTIVSLAIKFNLLFKKIFIYLTKC